MQVVPSPVFFLISLSFFLHPSESLSHNVMKNAAFPLILPFSNSRTSGWTLCDFQSTDSFAYLTSYVIFHDGV